MRIRRYRIAGGFPVGLGGRGLFLCMALLAGCTVGPEFRTAPVSMPPQWAGPVAVDSSHPSTLEGRKMALWWRRFRDPVMSRLIEQALVSGLDLKLADARVRQARAARGIAAAESGPAVDGAGSFRRSRASGEETEGPTGNRFLAGFDALWEIDLFGGLRRSREAADADLLAAEESRRGAGLTLAAEVARTYIDLRAFQRRIAIAKENLAAQRHSADLTRQRFTAGLVGGLDVSSADGQAASTAAAIPLLEASERQAIYSLDLLLGQAPASSLPELSVPAAIPVAPPEVPTGLPSDLLRRRPDILLAEAQAHAATARIGVATADLFPRFTLLGSVGYQADDSGSWFDPLSRFWSWGPSVDWPLFDSGRIRSNIEVQKALQEQSLIAYRQVVLEAIREVEEALIASSKEQERHRALAASLSANRRSVDLAIQLYTAGQTDFLNVLSAQRSLYAAEDALVLSASNFSTQLVALFKALGGGWGSDPEEETP